MSSENKDDGGPAFPCDLLDGRDWFAGQALAGLCSTISRESFVLMRPEPPFPVEASYAIAAYRLADAMLAERAK